jgi:BppU N-terminal domain
MSEKIKLVQGDTRPQIRVALTDDTTGLPVDITGATVVLKFRAAGDSVVLSTLSGTVTEGINGAVVFSWPEGALDVDSGDYEGEIEVTFADTTIQTVYETLKFKVREQF